MPWPAVGTHLTGSRASEAGDEQVEKMRLQQERLLLMREQQLLQREQQLHQVQMQQQQQQVLQKQLLQRHEQAPRLEAASPSLSLRPSQSHSAVLTNSGEIRPKHFQQQDEGQKYSGGSKEQLLHKEQQAQPFGLQEQTQMSDKRHITTLYSKELTAVCMKRGTEKAAEWRPSSNENERRQAFQKSASPHSKEYSVQSTIEGIRASSPLKKRRRTREKPSVLFTVVEESHETPVSNACFLPVGPSLDCEASSAASLLTASSTSLKMWDITRMTTKWKYTLSTRPENSPERSPLPSFWGLAPALGGCVVAGIGSSIQTFDVRGEKAVSFSVSRSYDQGT